MDTNGRSAGVGRFPPANQDSLLPVLARVFDLGRGPPALVGWVWRKLAALGVSAGELEPGRRRALLQRLAGELARLLHRDVTGETVAVGGRETVPILPRSNPRDPRWNPRPRPGAPPNSSSPPGSGSSS